MTHHRPRPLGSPQERSVFPDNLGFTPTYGAFVFRTTALSPRPSGQTNPISIWQECGPNRGGVRPEPHCYPIASDGSRSVGRIVNRSGAEVRRISTGHHRSHRNTLSVLRSRRTFHLTSSAHRFLWRGPPSPFPILYWGGVSPVQVGTGGSCLKEIGRSGPDSGSGRGSGEKTGEGESKRPWDPLSTGGETKHDLTPKGHVS